MLEKALDELKMLDQLLTRVISMPQLKNQLPNFMHAIQYISLYRNPLLSMICLRWIRDKMNDDEFYDWQSFAAHETPPTFYILDEVAIKHKLQRHSVFELWKSLLERPFKMAPIVVVQDVDIDGNA